MQLACSHPNRPSFSTSAFCFALSLKGYCSTFVRYSGPTTVAFKILLCFDNQNQVWLALSTPICSGRQYALCSDPQPPALPSVLIFISSLCSDSLQCRLFWSSIPVLTHSIPFSFVSVHLFSPSTPPFFWPSKSLLSWLSALRSILYLSIILCFQRPSPIWP